MSKNRHSDSYRLKNHSNINSVSVIPDTMVTSVKTILAEIESHVYSNAILTVTGLHDGYVVYDIEKKLDDTCNYGRADINLKMMLVAKLYNWFSVPNNLVVFVLRSFRDEKHPVTNFPLKDIRIYTVQQGGDQIEFLKVSPQQAMESFTVDAKTGEPLEIEPELTFM